jgi:SAM-dependent methyltransferase
MGRYYPDNYLSFGEVQSHDLVSSTKRFLRGRRTRYGLTGQGVLGRILYAHHPFPALAAMKDWGVTVDSTILDVGSGTGKLLQEMCDAGFRHVMGIDPYVENEIDQNCLKILKRTIHEVDPHWDLIMMHHSFEHMLDPLPTLISAAQLLAPDGNILVRIPIAGSWAWKNYGIDWVQIDAPRHYFLHTPTTMKILAGNHGQWIPNLPCSLRHRSRCGRNKRSNSIATAKVIRRSFDSAALPLCEHFPISCVMVEIGTCHDSWSGCRSYRGTATLPRHTSYGHRIQCQIMIFN